MDGLPHEINTTIAVIAVRKRINGLPESFTGICGSTPKRAALPGSAADTGARAPRGSVTVSDRSEDRPVPPLAHASARNARTRTTGGTDETSTHRGIPAQETIREAVAEDARHSRIANGLPERIEDSAAYCPYPQHRYKMRTTARPTRSRCTCAGWWRCGISTASTPAAATSPPPAANRTMCSTAGTAAAPASPTLKDYCYWHHHVLLHQLGWTLTAHPDGTSQVTSPDGKIIRSHSPPPRPG